MRQLTLFPEEAQAIHAIPISLSPREQCIVERLGRNDADPGIG